MSVSGGLDWPGGLLKTKQAQSQRLSQGSKDVGERPQSLHGRRKGRGADGVPEMEGVSSESKETMTFGVGGVEGIAGLPVGKDEQAPHHWQAANQQEEKVCTNMGGGLWHPFQPGTPPDGKICCNLDALQLDQLSQPSQALVYRSGPRGMMMNILIATMKWSLPLGCYQGR